MKYSQDERLKIGKRIFAGEINIHEAALIYDISASTARDYMRLYKAFVKIQSSDGMNSTVK
mgnify:CR=1 FL=1